MFTTSAGKLTAAWPRSLRIAPFLGIATTLLAANAAWGEAQAARDPVQIARAVVLQYLPAPAAADTYTIVTAEPLDPRLRLTPCADVPTGRLESNAIARGRALVRVSCRAPVSWNVFIPVRVETEAPVMVLIRNLPRGAAVTASDAAPQQRRFAGLSENYVKSGEPLTAYRLRRPVATGQVLARDALEPAPVVLRGAQVTVRAENAGFRIESSGRALADAAPGQRLRVQHPESLKIVEGVVDNVGIVRVGP
jgi:flagellar basal body P-ring formation protein FlgA